MSTFITYKYKILLVLFLLDILILILTALARKQYILYHFAEIVFFGFLILMMSNSIRNYVKFEEGLILVLNSALFAFSVLWLSGAIILERVQVELERDFYYALLMIIFLITILIFMILSLLEFYSNRIAIKSSLKINILTFTVTGVLFLLTTLLLAPQEDISEVIMKISNFL
ncbi:MAG: hypothetical protein ACW981_06820 [Candidatus Hodarchaeales archaeon]|jgi:hypothetical protein